MRLSETSAANYNIAYCHNPNAYDPNFHRRENLKSSHGRISATYKSVVDTANQKYVHWPTCKIYLLYNVLITVAIRHQ
jgi:hypothetical protein